MFVDKDKLINDLSNFYSDFGYDQSSIEFIFDTYVKAAEIVEDYILQVKNNMNISTIQTYRSFPYKIIETKNATYILDDLLYDKSVVDKLSLSSMTMQQRKDHWATLPNNEKVDILLSAGKYIDLTAKRSIDLKDYEIIYADIYNLKNTLLTQNSDYILQGNKIFLINDAATPTVYNIKLILKNIVVDYDTPQKLIGKNIGILYKDLITKPEYRDFMQVVVYASLGGPTIKNIKNALNTLSGLSNISIVDMVSAKGLQKQLWEGTSSLKPFDFLVSIPIDYFSSESKISVFMEFLDIIKPAYTNYVIAWAQKMADRIEDIKNADKPGLKMSDIPYDQITPTDSVKTTVSQSDTYAISMVQGQSVIAEFDSSDTHVTYDNNLYFDLVTQTIIPPGQDGYGDVCLARLIKFPEIPLEFNAVRDIYTGNINITFKDNAEGITRYEILRNDIIIATKTGDGNGGTITLSDTEFNNLSAGEYSYYARSMYEIDANKPELTKYSPPSKIVKIIR